MTYLLASNNSVLQYPYTVADLRRDNPGTSFPTTIPDERLAEWGVFPVAPVAPPPVGIGETLEELPPVFDAGEWKQAWSVRTATPEEYAARVAALQQSIVDATQNRLDTFAQTRGYDGILSACTYATSSVPRFAAEGQYAVNARDATWGALLGYLNDVQQGLQPVPSGFADVEPLLPALEWPQ